ncbi:MAG: hypothetical protein Q4D98_02460 [Planctomycetia bacterium]|nr:hypothetical protein [Planctomycetia bacterium]
MTDFPDIPITPTEDEERDDDSFFLSSVGFLASFSIHLILLLVLVLWRWEVVSVGFGGIAITSELVQAPLSEMETSPEEDSVDIETTPDLSTPKEEVEEVVVPEEPPTPDVLFPDELDVAPEVPESETGTPSPTEIGDEVYRTGNEEPRIAAVLPTSGGYEGRTDAALRARLMKDGATLGSEDAVRRGLHWICAHQQADKSMKKSRGSWNFDLRRAPYCTCKNSGESPSTTGATALALLAMLGHGNTRQEGEFQQSVREGLYYLSTRAIRRKGVPGLDLREGSIYGHALATLALCEAYAMEKQNGKDDGLKQLAKEACAWIFWAQDPVSGGWRYEPKEAGDVTVTTWMIMALKSAKECGIEIPSYTLIGVERFLNSVALDDNAQYCYQPGREPEPSTCAIGLVARMFTGAKQEARFLDRGTKKVSEWGYSGSDLYYDYYGALLLRHYGGERWERWNPALRDYLIATQSLSGHESGSWYFDEEKKVHNRTGGRLYTTALATMILEVYYRYMPLYQDFDSDLMRP